MAETSPSRYRTLAVLALTAALAGCAATHVGDDWQCPLAQGEVCTSIAAADPAVAPDAAPPPLATRTPLYRTPESEAETEPETTRKPGTKTRPCAEGCNPLAWLGRMLAPRGAASEAADNGEAMSAAPVERTPAPAATDQADAAPCGTEEPAPVDGDDRTDEIDNAGTPCAIAAEARETATPAPIEVVDAIAPPTAAVIPCGTDKVPSAPAESPVEAEGTTDTPASEDAETPCADPALVEETASAETGEADVSIAVNAETGEVEVTTDEDTAPLAAAAPPSAAAPLLPPPPAPDALRTGEVVGRIWIAPFVDAGGVYREGAWVRAVLAPAGWRR